MERFQITVAELSSLLRMIQVIPDADNVGRIRHMLLAFCTAWRTIGVRRAVLFLVDERTRVLRGHLAAERSSDGGDDDAASFENLARRVVENTQRIDTGDLTLRARSFSVPLEWPSSGAAKAANTGVPVLADRRLSEFANDPFFDYFASRGYVAIPLRLRGVVHAVLVADNGDLDRPIGVDDISLVYSVAQLATTAMDRLHETADNARKFRVLRKLQDVLASVEDTKRFGDALSAMLSMTARAVGAGGALLKDPLRKKITHVKTVEDVDVTDRETDISITDCFDEIMDRVAGMEKPVRGDSTHPMLNETAARVVRHFLVLPLVAGGDCLGAVAVYVEGHANGRSSDFPARDRLFLELVAGMMAERLDSLYRADQVRRAHRMFDEVQSNWVRERASARAGQRVSEHYDAVMSQLREMSHALSTPQGAEARVATAQNLLQRLQSETEAYREERDAERQSLELVDLFVVVRVLAEEWAVPVRAAGVDVTMRVAERGPVLLMDRSNVVEALANILGVLAGHLSKGDRALIECSATANRAIIRIADTAERTDGTLLARLFMPVANAADDDAQSPLSIAGDIIQRHGGEITVRSSPGWRTILQLSFPAAANSDRRARRDRRRRSNDRREQP